ncbi:hypothetical protein AVEN_14711-1 [Araneus ventricosus]|uniref:Uncharacterized protein n=1 Tax=Araneus ventricosus TaxID=182803 RepID=A0A4Y2LSL2_ARAVE|nr:hypothetical protein AVEN_14711-1 [Araneus ventricosus]
MKFGIWFYHQECRSVLNFGPNLAISRLSVRLFIHVYMNTVTQKRQGRPGLVTLNHGRQITRIAPELALFSPNVRTTTKEGCMTLERFNMQPVRTQRTFCGIGSQTRDPQVPKPIFYHEAIAAR